MTAVIGELFQNSSEGGWDWQIPDFPSLPEEVDKSYYSGTFFFSGAFWKLLLYPNGQSHDQSEGYISLYLVRVDSGRPFKLRFSLDVRKADGTEEIICEENDDTFHLEKDDSWGVAKFLKRTELDEYLSPSRVFTLTCNMIKCVHFVDDTSCESLRNTSTILLGLLTSEEEANVTFKLKDGELRAHRWILKARSEVFNRMFSTDMKESQNGEVNVPEADKDSFRVVLNYVYSGEPNGLFSKNVCSVYRIAHKYSLEELTKRCVEFMKEYMSQDMLYEAIEIAEVYEEKVLKDPTKDFFVKNFTEVVKTEEWKTLKKKNPEIVLHFFELVLTDNIAKIQI